MNKYEQEFERNTKVIEQLKSKYLTVFQVVDSNDNCLAVATQKLNSYLFKEYTYMKQVLQTVVDKFYSRHYEIPAFIPFTTGEFDYPLENLKLVLRNFKKLIDFI